MSNDLIPVEELLVLSATKSAIEDREKALRPLVAESLDSGDQKRPAVHGIPLGSVSKSTGEAVPQVVDEAAFHTYMDGQGLLSDEPQIVPDSLPEVLAVLVEHAPHLVGDHVFVEKSDLEAEFARVKNGGHVPGVALVEKTTRGDGLTVRSSKEAKARVAEVLAAGLLALEGGA